MSTKTWGKSAFNTTALCPLSLTLSIHLRAHIFLHISFAAVVSIQVIFVVIHISHKFKLQSVAGPPNFILVCLGNASVFLSHGLSLLLPSLHFSFELHQVIQPTPLLCCLLHFLHISVYHSYAWKSFNTFNIPLKCVASPACVYEIVCANNKLWLGQ